MMVKQTTKLLVKALVIGLLINLGLQQFPVKSSLLTEEKPQQEYRQRPLNRFPREVGPNPSVP